MRARARVRLLGLLGIPVRFRAKYAPLGPRGGRPGLHCLLVLLAGLVHRHVVVIAQDVGGGRGRGGGRGQGPSLQAEGGLRSCAGRQTGKIVNFSQK